MRTFKKGLCRLFKDDKPLNERMYYALGVVHPCNTFNVKEGKADGVNIIKFYEAKHTEIENATYGIFLLEDGRFISPLLSEPHVIYQAMYGSGIIYLRPYEMFMSLADKEKYPQYPQKYRLEFAEDDYRFKPIKQSKSLESDTSSVIYYLGEIRITASITYSEETTVDLTFDVPKEHYYTGISANGVFYEEVLRVSDNYVGRYKPDDLNNVIIERIYAAIESYENYGDDLLREKAISNKEINW